MSRRLRIALAVVAALVVIRIALPFALKPILESQLGAALGRPVTIDRVVLAFSRGAVGIEGLLVGEGEHALAKVARASANLHFMQLFTGELRVETVELEEPIIAVRLHDDGTLEPFVLGAKEPEEATPEAQPEADAEPESEETDPVADDETGGAWPIRVDRLDLADFSVLLVPQADPEEGVARFDVSVLELSNFSIVDGVLDFGSIRVGSPRLSVPRDLAIAPAAPVDPETEPGPVAPASDSGGPLITGSDLTIENAELEVQLGDDVVTLNVDAKLRDVSFAEGARFPVELRVARRDGRIQFDGEAGVQPVAVKGTLAFESLSLLNLVRLANPEIAARIEKGLLSGKLALDVGVEENGLRAAVDGGLTVVDLAANAEDRFVVAGETRVKLSDLRITPLASGDAGTRARVASVEMDGLGIRDETVEPSALIEMPEVRVHAEGLRLPERDLALDITFKTLLGATGTATSRLEGGSGRTEVSIAGFPLEEFSGYAAAAGFLLESGIAHLEGGIDTVATVQKAAFDVGLEDLRIQTVDAGLFQQTLGMSPGLALALLEDPTGAVRLPVHFEVDTASGETGLSVAGLLTGALRQGLTGLATAPLKGIGFIANGVIGADGTLQLDPIVFEPGSSQWAEGQGAYVDAMARKLVARPLAGVSIVGRASEEEARTPERLAEERAQRVYDAFLEAGVDPAALAVAPVDVGETGVLLTIGGRPAPAAVSSPGD